MGSLTFIEKRKLERALGMSSGYVLEFSNRTFAEFFRKVAAVDIFDSKFDFDSGSKANRMRAFWNLAHDREILLVLEGLHAVWADYCSSVDEAAREVIWEIIMRLKSGDTDGSCRPGNLAKIEDIQFPVALSFSGSHRPYVERVAAKLKSRLGIDKVFYDRDYQAQLAKPDLDTLLQRIYRRGADLVVVFLGGDYAASEWCGLEWRAVRDIIKSKRSDQIMFVRFDGGLVEGAFSLDGYIDASMHDESAVAEYILQRVILNQPIKETFQSPDVTKPSELAAESIHDLVDALRVLQRETKFLWLALLETKPTELVCSADVRQSTIARIDSAVRFLEEFGHFDFKSVHAYSDPTTKEPVFKVTLEHISTQLVNLARKLEAKEPRPALKAEYDGSGQPATDAEPL